MFEENLELQKFVVKLLPWTNDVDPSVRMVHILMVSLIDASACQLICCFDSWP